MSHHLRICPHFIFIMIHVKCYCWDYCMKKKKSFKILKTFGDNFLLWIVIFVCLFVLFSIIWFLSKKEINIFRLKEKTANSTFYLLSEQQLQKTFCKSYSATFFHTLKYQPFIIQQNSSTGVYSNLIISTTG